MQPLNVFINKYVMYAIYVLAIMSLINGCNGCNTAKEVTKVRRELDTLQAQVKSQYYDKKDLDNRLSILSLEGEKSTLFNVNYIVLTKARPDTRMNEIDQKIKELRSKLK